jgi:parvulin-like peptidyl-prolyl isomerase
MWRFARGTPSGLAFAALPAAGLLLLACRHDTGKIGSGPASSASTSLPAGLSPELSARVLARVGDRVITLGDYATVLGHMDRFERLRYQTADRRKQLLDEMINVELLAREAERRGLTERAETKELVRQILRDEVIRDLRNKQPPLEQIPAGEVSAYYQAHRNDFKEPERRRVAHIVTRDRALAERALAEAKTATAKQWGELVQKYGTDPKGADVPLELAGDLGMVTPPSWGKNDNPRVPEAVRAAAFEIGQVSGVLGRTVEDAGSFHVVRLTGKNDPRDRSLEEAERPIRVRLMQENLRRAEEELGRELRARFPVQVDDAALAKAAVPDTGKKP